jgi:hypothetical protein
MYISQAKLREIMQSAYEIGIQEGWKHSTKEDNFQQGTGNITTDTIIENYQSTIDREIEYEINQLKK